MGSSYRGTLSGVLLAFFLGMVEDLYKSLYEVVFSTTPTAFYHFVFSGFWKILILHSMCWLFQTYHISNIFPRHLQCHLIMVVIYAGVLHAPHRTDVRNVEQKFQGKSKRCSESWSIGFLIWLCWVFFRHLIKSEGYRKDSPSDRIQIPLWFVARDFSTN